MIELINEDYADFVNLSSNLVGLNQSIDGIQIPLGQLKEEIIVVKMTLADTMNDLQNSLMEKKTLRNHLKSVRSVGKVQKLIGNLENLLVKQLSSTDLNPTLLERAAFCYVQLVYDLQVRGIISNVTSPIRKTVLVNSDAGSFNFNCYEIRRV